MEQARRYLGQHTTERRKASLLTFHGLQLFNWSRPQSTQASESTLRITCIVVVLKQSQQQQQQQHPAIASTPTYMYCDQLPCRFTGWQRSLSFRLNSRSQPNRTLSLHIEHIFLQNHFRFRHRLLSCLNLSPPPPPRPPTEKAHFQIIPNWSRLNRLQYKVHWTNDMQKMICRMSMSRILLMMCFTDDAVVKIWLVKGAMLLTASK